MKSRRELEQIFERVSRQFSFEDAHLELATDERMDALIEFAITVYMPDEPLSKSLNIERDEEMLITCKHILRDNISILLVSDTTGEIIALRASHVTNKEDSNELTEVKNEKIKIISKFLAQKDDELNVFDKYGVAQILHLDMLGVDKRFRQRGIASKIMNAAILFYSEIGLDPVVFKGEATSNFSKAIYEKCGFETLHEFVYEDYKIDNEVVFKNTGVHKSTKIYAKRL